MRAFFAAISFLTPVHVPEAWCGGEQGLRRAPVFFPIVGLMIGGVAAAAMVGLDSILAPLPASTIVVLILVAASAGLHIDGLSDSADGLFSARSRERALEIMKDSHVGAMGVVTVVGVLLLKVALLSSIEGSARWQMVLVAPVAGRCALLIVMAAFPYARAEGGLATVFRSGPRSSALLLTWGVVAALAVGWLLGSYRGLMAAGCSLAVALLVGWYVYRRVGGYTGDTLGATSELVEILPFFVAAVWIK